MADMELYRNRAKWLTAEDRAYVAQVKAATGQSTAESEFALANRRRNESRAPKPRG